VLSPDGLLVATTSDVARLWKAKTGDAVIELVGQQGRIRAATRTADGNRVVTLGDDRVFQVWDAATGKELARSTQTGEDHEAGTHRIAIRPDGDHAATVGGDDMVRLWDVKTGRLLAVLEGHQGSSYGVAYNADGQRIVTASSDRTVRVWDAGTRGTIAVIEGTEPMWNAAFSTDGERLVTASEDQSARIWRVFPTMQALVDQAHGIVPRCLTVEQRRQAFLDPEPPAWCAVEKKWPYHAAR
jgi:WD40 repeat protein